MSQLIDLTGKKFGRLTVLGIAPERKQNKVTWSCLCECGTQVNVRGDHLRNGAIRSCGCLGKENLATYQHNRAIDITNQRFGKLIALEPTNEHAADKSII